MTTPPPDEKAFADSLAQLEARIAEADAAGEDVPDEAREMVVKLRELMSALSDLTRSLGGGERPPEVSS